MTMRWLWMGLASISVVTFGCLAIEDAYELEFRNLLDTEIMLRADAVPSDTSLPHIPLGDATRASVAGCGRSLPDQVGLCVILGSKVRTANRDDYSLLITAFDETTPGMIVYQGKFEWDHLNGTVLEITDQRSPN